ncbi:hypothetical protein GLOIN_2v1785142 [Rhizophagus clarus]|uniref:Uncharacterized protein n=1 Tax=Rhizophagus clarus TaxID=94130 RepID=A0A8H3QH42_9GLOM|nr:hypothetical protein GLOIN_2v1785142 [Rhizophagus clarus]
MMRKMKGDPEKEKDIIGSSAQGFGTDLVTELPDLECCQPSWTNRTWEMLPAFLDEPDLGMLPAFLDEPDLGILLNSGLEILSHTHKESEELIAQLHRFELRLAPFDLSYSPGLESPKDLTESKLRESINISSVTIRNIVDLTAIDGINEEMGSNIILTQEQPLDPADLNYDPNDVLNGFLEHERNLTEILENHEP